MPRKRTRKSALSIGQVATLWGISRERVVRLIDAEELTGAFRIPSAGRFRETTRIPIASALEAEAKWAINGNGNHPKAKRPARKRNGVNPDLKHFPELNDPPEPPAATDEVE
jgi:hypothetical protein